METPSAATPSASAPSPLAQERPPPSPDAPWNEKPPPLRPAQGIVRDALTKAPVVGAWVTWHLPPPEMREKILAAGDLPASPEFSMVTDARGRFRLERLPDGEPLSHKVHAVARGYAPGGVEVGLSREVVIELRPAAPGEEAEGAAKGGRPPRRVEAIVEGPEGPLRDGRVVLVHEITYERIEAETDATGLLAATVSFGNHVGYIEDGLSLRRAEGLVVSDAKDTRRLALESRGEELRVTLRLDGQSLSNASVGIVGLAGPHPDLIELRGVGDGVFQGLAPRARYALFDDTRLLAEIDHTGDGRLDLDLTSLAVDLRLRVPDDLGDEEALRVEASVMPAFVAANPMLRSQFLESAQVRLTARRNGPPHRLTLVAKGVYILAGVSDLGPVYEPFPVRASGEVEIDIAPP